MTTKNKGGSNGRGKHNLPGRRYQLYSAVQNAQYKVSREGSSGPASPVRRIDPLTGLEIPPKPKEPPNA